MLHSKFIYGPRFACDAGDDQLSLQYENCHRHDVYVNRFAE